MTVIIRPGKTLEMSKSHASAFIPVAQHGRANDRKISSVTAPNVRTNQSENRKQRRDGLSVSLAEPLKQAWQTIRIVTVGGFVGLVFVAGICFAGQTEEKVDDPIVDDAKIATMHSQ